MRLSPSFLAGVALATVLLVGTTAEGATVPHRPGYPPLSSCRRFVRTEVLHRGVLTFGTNNPALAPWFVDNDPGNGKGYESALAYQLGGTLGFAPRSIQWVSEPFELAETPGAKPFDVDVNEATYDPSLTGEVSFSTGYFTVNESLVALKHSRVVTSHRPAALRGYRYGALSGSPGLHLVRTQIHPKVAAIAYATISQAVDALVAHKVDALVLDTPTGHYLVSQQLPAAMQVGQFHVTGQEYALVLAKNNPLLACVDSALHSLRKSGVLTSLAHTYLQVYERLAFLRP